MAQTQETQQIEVVVQVPIDESDTSSTMSVRYSRRTASRDRIRPHSPMASSSSCASLGRVNGAPPIEGTTVGSSSSSTQNTSRASLRAASYKPAEPITASDVKRNDRGRTAPKKKKEVVIEPGMSDFDDLPRYGDWAPHVHPDGALYFFDPKRRIYTEADLSKASECEAISYYAEQLLQEARNVDKFPWATCELVLERTKTGCGYYFVEPGKRCILWLRSVSGDIMTKDLDPVQSLAHIKYIMEAEYWTHCMHFPNDWSVTPEVVAELKQMVLHAITDSIASTTSVIPFDQEELAKILDLTKNLKDAIDEPFPHASSIVARFMQDFASAKFFNFCGQPWARLNSDQSIISKTKPRRSLFIILLSFFLFWAPCDYAKELDGIWVDQMTNRNLWKQFMAKLKNDWSSLALYATLMLNASVALPSKTDSLVAKSFSFVSTVTSVGAVVIGLVLVRLSQKNEDSAEQADTFLGNVYNWWPVLGTEPLAVIFSLPYALIMWSMLLFVIAFVCMVFESTHLATQSIFGIAFGLVCVLVLWTVLTTRAAGE